MMIWGFSDKYQPRWKVEDLRAEMERLTTHGSAAPTGDGLSVNLKDRHVTEFFHKKYLLRDIHLAIPQGHMVVTLVVLAWMGMTFPGEGLFTPWLSVDTGITILLVTYASDCCPCGYRRWCITLRQP